MIAKLHWLSSIHALIQACFPSILSIFKSQKNSVCESFQMSSGIVAVFKISGDILHILKKKKKILILSQLEEMPPILNMTAFEEVQLEKQHL